MKVCLAQINTTPGDFDGNRGRILKGIEAASDAGCDLIVFPELTIPGYLSQDLLYNPDFIDRNLETLQIVIEASVSVSADLHIVLGYVDRNTGTGKPFFNMAGVIRNGELTHTYKKQLLPFYDVFDELRYFEPGNDMTVLDIAGRKAGIAICEDLWNDKNTDDYNYEDNPLARYREADVDLLISLNSSPFVQGKCEQRLRHITPATADGFEIIYVNQVGGQDELVFDGQSFVASGGAPVYMCSTLFEDAFDIIELEPDPPAILPDSTITLEQLLTLGLRDYVFKSGFDRLVVASSGGVDSAVVLKLACDAIGAENVHAVRMPSVFSSHHSTDDAVQLHTNLGCHDYEVPIDHEGLVAELNRLYTSAAGVSNPIAGSIAAAGYNSVADENIQARLRDVYLMHFSNAFGAMPLSTGNKTESGCGYYTHFDMNFSFAPIKDLYKFQVVEIAKADSRIPHYIWQKPPSAELSYGQTDEASLLPYAVLDPIVMAYVEDYVTMFDRFNDWVGGQAEQRQVTGDLEALNDWLHSEGALNDYERIVSLIGKMEYKRRQTCPGTKVSKVAFGIGRRIPIVEKWS